MCLPLTQGYNFANNCATNAGSGEVLFIEKSNFTSFALTANVVTTITRASTKVFRSYLVDEGTVKAYSNFNLNPTNDTYKYEHKLDITLKGWTTAVANEVKLLGLNRVVAIVKGNNGIYRIYAPNVGLKMVTGTDENEEALDGFIGHKLSFTANETVQAYEVDSSIIAALLTP